MGGQEWSWESPQGGGKPGWFAAVHSPDDREVFLDPPAAWIDAKSGETNRQWPHPAKVRYALSANGRYLSGIENGELVLLDATSLEEGFRISISTERIATVRRISARSETGR
jgi:hypothetical protein